LVEAVVKAVLVIKNAMIPVPTIKITGRKGHPETHCPKEPNEDNDCSLASTASRFKKLKKDLESIKKAFITFNTRIEDLKEA
jgi:hypothetical protein